MRGPAGDVGQSRPKDRKIIDPAVLVEPLVFGREDRLPHQVRHLFDLDDRPALLAEFSQQRPFRREDSQRDFGLIVGQGLKRR